MQRIPPEHRKEIAAVIEKNAAEFEEAVKQDLRKRTGETLATVTNEEIAGTNGLARKVGVGERGGGDGWYVIFDEWGAHGRPGQAPFFGNWRRLKMKFKARLRRANKKALQRAMR